MNKYEYATIYESDVGHSYITDLSVLKDFIQSFNQKVFINQTQDMTSNVIFHLTIKAQNRNKVKNIKLYG